MTFIRRTSAGRLPVALGAEAVAVRHQTLAGEAGQLVQPVQILEGRREGAVAAVVRNARIPISCRAA